jgi:hypothetical protein
VTGRHRAAPGRHEAPPAPGTLAAAILAWQGRAAEHARISTEYRACEHDTPDIIAHITSQLTAAGQLISHARQLFLLAQHGDGGAFLTCGEPMHPGRCQLALGHASGHYVAL